MSYGKLLSGWALFFSGWSTRNRFASPLINYMQTGHVQNFIFKAQDESFNFYQPFSKCVLLRYLFEWHVFQFSLFCDCRFWFLQVSKAEKLSLDRTLSLDVDRRLNRRHQNAIFLAKKTSLLPELFGGCHGAPPAHQQCRCQLSRGHSNAYGNADDGDDDHDKNLELHRRRAPLARPLAPTSPSPRRHRLSRPSLLLRHHRRQSDKVLEHMASLVSSDRSNRQHGLLRLGTLPVAPCRNSFRFHPPRTILLRSCWAVLGGCWQYCASVLRLAISRFEWLCRSRVESGGVE